MEVKNLKVYAAIVIIFIVLFAHAFALNILNAKINDLYDRSEILAIKMKFLDRAHTSDVIHIFDDVQRLYNHVKQIWALLNESDIVNATIEIIPARTDAAITYDFVNVSDDYLVPVKRRLRITFIDTSTGELLVSKGVVIKSVLYGTTESWLTDSGGSILTDLPYVSGDVLFIEIESKGVKRTFTVTVPKMYIWDALADKWNYFIVKVDMSGEGE